jgi:arachidonate 15-lipoxygenase (second type) / 8-lipoxygenase (S-type)
MYAAFGIRPLALTILFRPGGYVDQFFPYTGQAAATFSEDQYNGEPGAFLSNYFRTDLQRRGLINPSVGPALTHFPFYEDGAVIHDAIRTFMGTFVNSYYPTAATIRGDKELQAWLTEANGPAKAMDFPTSATLNTPAALADLLTHMAHLVSTAHHSVNTNQLITGSGVLPFNPSALYKPIPTSKGASDLAAYLPPVLQCIQMIQSQGDFARPLLASTNRTLLHMFDDATMLNRMNPATRAGNAKFMAAMQAQSNVVKSRTFDGQGLSQGMPFVWKALDPNVAPFSLTI